MADARLEVLIKVRDQASRELDRLTQKTKGLGGAMKSLRGPVLAAGTAAIGATVAWAKAGDEVQKMAKRTGFGTESLSELRFALQQSGSSIQGFERSVRTMGSFLEDAKDGLSTSVVALDKLNLSTEDFEGLNPEQAFFKFADAIAEVEDDMQRAALAQDIFGRSGTALFPLLAEGAEGIAALRAEARELGITFTEDGAQKAAEFMDASNALKQVITGMIFEIGSLAGPVLTGLARGFQALPGPLQKVVAVVGLLAVAMKLKLIPAIKLTSITMKSALIASGIGLVLVAIVLLIEHWDVVKEVLIGGAKKIKEFFVGTFEKIKNAVVSAFEFLRGHLPEVMTIITAIIAGPFAPIVALATDAFGIRSALVDAFGSVRDFIKGIFDDIVGFFKAIPGRVANVGKLIINVIIDVMNRGIRLINAIIPDEIGFDTPFGFVGVDLPDNPIKEIPRLQGGAKNFPGGLAVVGEAGPEVVNLPSGSDVVANESLFDFFKNLGFSIVQLTEAGLTKGLTPLADTITRSFLTLAEAIAEGLDIAAGGGGPGGTRPFNVIAGGQVHTLDIPNVNVKGFSRELGFGTADIFKDGVQTFEDAARDLTAGQRDLLRNLLQGAQIGKTFNIGFDASRGVSEINLQRFEALEALRSTGALIGPDERGFGVERGVTVGGAGPSGSFGQSFGGDASLLENAIVFLLSLDGQQIAEAEAQLVDAEGVA